MSKRKGMSMDEKGAKILEIFHEAGEVFQLKDIEKLGVKRGVNGQSIKDVVQNLLNDDLIKTEKIGSSNYYWSFPAEQSTKLSASIAQAERDLEATQQKRSRVQAELSKLKAGQEDLQVRVEVTAKLTSLRQEVSSLESTLAQYADQDPDTVKQIHKATQLSKDAANRWLDNTHILASWCKKKFQNMDDALAALYKEYGYHPDLEPI